MVRTDWWLPRLWDRYFYRPVPVFHRNFLSLGYNCELAFRYNRQNGFVDSGLFQWGYSASLDQLIYALENFDRLFTGEILDPNPLYECANTGIRQHGKASMALWMDGVRDEDRATMVADRQDLFGRMAHLKRKFVDTLNSDEALVVYKIRSEEYLDPSAEAKVNHLLSSLSALGKGNFTFLLVCESRCHQKSIRLSGTDRYIRYVRNFNPDDQVTDYKQGDGRGWTRIFREFLPMEKRRNSHKFKFEEKDRRIRFLHRCG